MLCEGDTIISPTGAKTRVYDLATCTETRETVIIHGTSARTMTTPLKNFGCGWQVLQKGGKDAGTR